MRFRVMDNKTGKEADPYEIALHEEWAQGLVYCDMEGFVITENGDLMLADECGNVVYCDPERFKVVFEVGWIPCSERLPERDERVLVSFKTGSVHLCKYLDDGSENPWWSYIDDCCAWNNTVVAWMPLPTPYMKEGDQE